MSLRVNTNVPAINTHRNLTLNNTAQAKSMERLSSGLKINRGADGPASLVISERLRAQTAGLKQAMDNSEAGISLVQTAEAALDTHHIDQSSPCRISFPQGKPHPLQSTFALFPCRCCSKSSRKARRKVIAYPRKRKWPTTHQVLR